MDRKTLKKLAEDPKYISGIYNYCDRWCERCPFGSRCLNRTLVEEQFGDLQEKDELNEVFWQRFSEMLTNTFALLREMAEEAGVDLQRIDDDPDGKGETGGTGTPWDISSLTLRKNMQRRLTNGFIPTSVYFTRKRKNSIASVSYRQKMIRPAKPSASMMQPRSSGGTSTKSA